MKRMIATAIALALVAAYGCGSAGTSGPPDEALRAGFAAPPDSMQISAYWYWISGNVSKEGILRDLESMKKAGISRAFIGNIGLPENEAPLGPVKLLATNGGT